MEFESSALDGSYFEVKGAQVTNRERELCICCHRDLAYLDSTSSANRIYARSCLAHYSTQYPDRLNIEMRPVHRLILVNDVFTIGPGSLTVRLWH